MSKVETIERDVAQLDDGSFAAFREWFLAHENERWDRQIANDSRIGKLDDLIKDAIEEHRAGNSTRL